MKRFLYFISAVISCSLILSACNIPVVTSAPALPAATEAPILSTQPPQPPVVVEASPALVQVNLAGPPMEVGSKYLYVDGTVLVAVPGGEFTMGYNSADNPIHQVSLSDFWIYSTKVTNQQYAQCVNAGKCAAPDAKNAVGFGDYHYINFPVTGINYDQSASYCTFVHGRLPTEAEWEKTARGPDGNLFPWGDEGTTCSLLNFKACVGKTTAVNDYPAGVSYYGAFDMSGNAREWVADWYSPAYYSQSPAADPLGPVIGEKRSVRGSSYQDGTDPALSAHRFSLLPVENLPDLGFRCVVEDPTYFAPACGQLLYLGQGPSGEQADCVPDIKCNSVNIKQSPNCTGKPDFISYTIVTFTLSNTPPEEWTYDVPGCSSPVGGEANKFQCNLPGPYTATAQGSCVDNSSCKPACPAHYKQVGDTCVWDGSSTLGTACIDGSTYDPLAKCCSLTPGSAVNFNSCPAGYFSLNGVCVENSKMSVDTELQAVIFATDTCHPLAKKNNGGCTGTEPAWGCIKEMDNSNAYWDPKKCKCVVP